MAALQGELMPQSPLTNSQQQQQQLSPIRSVSSLERSTSPPATNAQPSVSEVTSTGEMLLLVTCCTLPVDELHIVLPGSGEAEPGTDRQPQAGTPTNSACTSPTTSETKV